MVLSVNFVSSPPVAFGTPPIMPSGSGDVGIMTTGCVSSVDTTVEYGLGLVVSDSDVSSGSFGAVVVVLAVTMCVDRPVFVDLNAFTVGGA